MNQLDGNQQSKHSHFRFDKLYIVHIKTDFDFSISLN